MTPREVLADIGHELREHPERWTQGANARDAEGRRSMVASPKAVCWCLWGHLCRRERQRVSQVAMQLLTTALDDEDPVFWNDVSGRTADQVAALCERAARE